MANHHTRAVPELSEEQREELQRWLRRSKTSQALALRSRIVLRCASGSSDVAVAQELGTTRATVGKWRRRFLQRGCDGLLDEPRPGTPRQVSDEDVERVVVRTLETLPKGATQWSTRSMARECGMSFATVGRIWRTFGLKPHRTETFKLSKDPLFIEKVRGCTCTLRNVLRCCVWTRSRRSRRWIGHSPCFRCAPGYRGSRRMTTSAMARLPCLRR